MTNKIEPAKIIADEIDFSPTKSPPLWWQDPSFVKPKAKDTPDTPPNRAQRRLMQRTRARITKKVQRAIQRQRQSTSLG